MLNTKIIDLGSFVTNISDPCSPGPRSPGGHFGSHLGLACLSMCHKIQMMNFVLSEGGNDCVDVLKASLGSKIIVLDGFATKM